LVKFFDSIITILDVGHGLHASQRPLGGFEPPNRAFFDTVMKFGTVLLKTPYNNFRCGERFAPLAETPWGFEPQKFCFHEISLEG